MAFATSNVQMGNCGAFHALVGDWTSLSGDTSGTVTVGGARVYSVEFVNQDGDVGMNSRMEYSVSLSGSLSTVTVNLSSQAVTNGRFLIVYR